MPRSPHYAFCVKNLDEESGSTHFLLHDLVRPSSLLGSTENDQHQKMINMAKSENDQHLNLWLLMKKESDQHQKMINMAKSENDQHLNLWLLMKKFKFFY